jgi:hypothetical protein
MFLKTAQINHDSENLDQALNLSLNQLYRCRERIIFSTVANALQGRELYEDDEDCPKEFRTVTGDLARTLSLITDPLEYEYTLLTFTRLQDLTTDTIAKWLALNNSELSKGSRAKLEFMMNLADLVIEHKSSFNDDDDDDDNEKNSSDDRQSHTITPGGLFKRIDLVKRSQYSWDTYYNLVKSKNYFYGKVASSSGSDFDIDNMLNNIFNRDDE